MPDTVRVLIVDDSVVFRSQIKGCLEDVEGISVAATAANGKIALERLEQQQCDVITLDMEMPEMDGLTFLREIRKRNWKQRVIVFAAPSRDGARQVFEAFEAGAQDFVAKPAGVSSIEAALEGIKAELVPKLRQFAGRISGRDRAPESSGKAALSPSEHSPATSRAPRVDTKINLESFKPKVIVIASSTGGPTALEALFSLMKGKKVTVPILIAQHMPPNFTEYLARRLETLSGIPAAEGRPGELISPGRIYIAPGDFHMSIQRTPNDAKMPIIKLDQGPKRNSVRPAADFLFESAAKEFGAKVAGVVLTGMGEDGCQGAVAIKNANGAIIIQNKESSVVWGMPGAVHAAGAFDEECNIESCARYLLAMSA